MQVIIYILSVALVLGGTIFIVKYANKHKKIDKNSSFLFELLPGLNCKECGRNDCKQFAEDLSNGKTHPDVCPYLQGEKYIKVREVLKRERKVMFDKVAFVKCKGGCDCKNKFTYVGENTCKSKNLLHSGDKFCPFACLGCGDCIKSCKYGAISISQKGSAVVDRDRCVGCGECLNSCPNKLIELVPSNQFVDVVCKNSSDDSTITRNCKVSCNHCEACIVACPTGAIQMVGGLPKIDPEKCIRCGKCVAVCPSHVISRL